MNDAQDKFSGAQFSDFITNPQALLKRNPIGGLQLSGEVKGLTVTDPLAAVDALLNIARSANSAQAAAIGSGLGQAVKAILAVDKSCGEDLARKITGSGLEDLLTAYNMAIAETPMLLDGGSGGGVGGVVNGTSSSSTGVTTSAGGSTSHTNTAETFSFSGSTYTCSTSVSPRRKC
ncbi:MAG TPA: hypothetical protein DDW73_15945 [Rhizobium sp.]|nr:hypothetical protein [Rhizobium sp.]